MNVAVGIIVAAAVSIAVAFGCRYWLPASLSRRCGLAVALAAGFVVGYALLPEWAEWIPTRHWHWPPWIAIAAAILGPVGVARGVWPVERWLLGLILAFASACVLVPDWEDLQPNRHYYVGFLTAYLWMLATTIPPLVDRISLNFVRGLQGTVAIVLSVALLGSVSLRFGQLAGLAATATVGSLVSGVWYKDPVAHRAQMPVFSCLAGGLAFIGCIEPQQALPGLLIIPAVPLVLWLTSSLPLPKQGYLALAVHTVAVSLVIVASVAWVLID